MLDVEANLPELQRALLRNATSKLGNIHDAQDVVQDVLLAVHQHRDRFETLEHLEGFAHLTLRNRCVNFHRDSARRAAPTDDLPETADLRDGRDSEAQTIDRERTGIIVAALRRMNPRYAVMLAAVSEHGSDNYETLAAVTGENVSAVRNVLSRARKDLAAQITAAGHSIRGLVLPAGGFAFRHPILALAKARKGRRGAVTAAAVPAIVIPALLGALGGGWLGGGAPVASPVGPSVSTNSLLAGPVAVELPIATPTLDPDALAAALFAGDTARLLRENVAKLPEPSCTELQGHGVCWDAVPENEYWTELGPKNDYVDLPWIAVESEDCREVEPLMRCVPTCQPRDGNPVRATPSPAPSPSCSPESASAQPAPSSAPSSDPTPSAEPSPDPTPTPSPTS